MRRMIAALLVTVFVAYAFGTAAAQIQTPAWVPTAYDPPWAAAAVKRTIPLAYDSNKTAVQNGAALVAAIAALQPGDRLLVGSGTWSMNSWVDVKLQGTAAAPIRIEAADPNKPPVLTRPDANQNVINLGAQGQVRYLALLGLEFTGGDDLLKLYDCENVWIDSCYIHDGSGVGIAANSKNTRYLYITRNEITRPGKTGDTGEGMYLGANYGTVTMSYSVVALNHVHHTTAGSQGDGIEVKQGSHHNWIVANLIHDTRYPCLIAYGTGGNDVNLLERNTLYNCLDNTMQVQGEALVRNNLIMNATGSGFQSHDHQAQTLNLVFVHNTVITPGRGANLSSWNNRAGMVFANNVVYSRSSDSIRFPNGSGGVTLRGNVAVGTVSGATSGWVNGTGLGDFVDVAWDASKRGAAPARGSIAAARARRAYSVTRDLNGATRLPPVDSGALDALASFSGDKAVVSLTTGGTVNLALDAGPGLAGKPYQVAGSLSGVVPGVAAAGWWIALNPDAYFFHTVQHPNLPPLAASAGVLDVGGRAVCRLQIPARLPAALVGFKLHHAFAVFGSGLRYTSNPVTVAFAR